MLKKSKNKKVLKKQKKQLTNKEMRKFIIGENVTKKRMKNYGDTKKQLISSQ